MMNEIIQSAFKSDEPKVGMGVTELCWSDRHAYTLIWISGRKIGVQRDRATRIDKNGMSDMQDYSFEADEKGEVVVLTQRKDGHWRKIGARQGNVFMLGHREEYYDYSF